MEDSIIKSLPDSNKTQAGQSVSLRLKSWFTQDSNLTGVLRGGGLVFLLSVAGFALGYLSQVALARWLGPKQFGIYAYAWSWIRLLAVFGTFGLAQAMLRFFPQYTANKDWARAAGLWRYGRAMVFCAATLIALGAALAAWVLQDRNAGHYAVTLWVAFGAVPLLALMQTQREMARAFGRPVLAYLPRRVIYPLLIIIAALLLSASGVTLSAVLMMVVTLFVLLAIIPVQGWLLKTKIPGEMRTARSVLEIRVWLQVAFPLFLTNGCRVLLSQTSLIMLGAYMKPEDVAVYFAAARIADLVTFVLNAMNALGAPKIARLYALNKHLALQRFVSGAARWIFWPSLCTSIVLIFFGQIPLGMFGSQFTAGASVLSILVFGHLISASVGPVGYLLNMTGHQDTAAWIFGSTAAFNIILNALLIPQYGILGAAAASATSIAIKNIVTFIFVRRRLKIHSFVFFAPPTPKSN